MAEPVKTDKYKVLNEIIASLTRIKDHSIDAETSKMPEYETPGLYFTKIESLVASYDKSVDLITKAYLTRINTKKAFDELVEGTKKP